MSFRSKSFRNNACRYVPFACTKNKQITGKLHAEVSLQGRSHVGLAVGASHCVKYANLLRLVYFRQWMFILMRFLEEWLVKNSYLCIAERSRSCPRRKQKWCSCNKHPSSRRHVQSLPLENVGRTFHSLKNNYLIWFSSWKMNVLTSVFSYTLVVYPLIYWEIVLTESVIFILRKW